VAVVAAAAVAAVALLLLVMLPKHRRKRNPRKKKSTLWQEAWIWCVRIYYFSSLRWFYWTRLNFILFVCLVLIFSLPVNFLRDLLTSLQS
jgi:hypothetical protein